MKRGVEKPVFPAPLLFSVKPSAEMRNPLLPVVVIVALFILIGEGLFGCFSHWLNPSRSPSHYAHYVIDNESQSLQQSSSRQQEQWLLVRLTSMPEQRPNGYRCEAEVIEITDSSGAIHPCKGKIQLFFAATPRFDNDSTPQKGDEMLLLAAPKRPSPALNPHQFDYRRHLQKRGILYTAYLPDYCWQKTGHTGCGLASRIAQLRQRLIDVIRHSRLTSSQQGIAEALFLGWDNDLDEETVTSFRQAGITHLLCVSGLHVGIVTLLAGWLLSFIGNNRRGRIIKGLFQLAITWFFVALTGMAPGTMRAGLMFSLIVIGQMFYSRPPTLNAIAASALVLLVANPLLLFDIGFQLSYCSVLAIVLFMRPLEEVIPIPKTRLKALDWLLRKIRSLLCVSIVAQLGISPLILYYFHQFPLYFIVANVVVVPFAGLLLGTVMLMVAVSWWNWAFNTVGILLSHELAATEWVTHGVASWPNSLIENIWFDGWMLLLAFLIVAMLGLLLVRRLHHALPIALLLGIIMAVYALRVESLCARQMHFDIYNVGYRTAVEFFAGHESYLLCDSVTAQQPEKIDYQTSANLLRHQVKERHIIRLDSNYESPWLLVYDRFVGFAGKTFRIIDRSNYRSESSYRPKTDYLLLCGSPFITIGELKQKYDFDTILFASQNSKRRLATWQQQCDSLSVPYR